MSIPQRRQPARRLHDVPARIVPKRVARVSALAIGGTAEDRRLMLRILSHLGLRQASEFPLCKETFDKITASRPDFLLLDFAERPALAAGLMAGIRRQAFPLHEIPVIAVVDRLTPRGAQALVATGVDHILTRPLSPAAVYLRIEHVMHAPRSFVKSVKYFGPARRGMEVRPQIAADSEIVATNVRTAPQPAAARRAIDLP